MDLKTPPLNYNHTVADEATLSSDGRCEVIVVADASKYSVDLHHVCRLNNLSTSAFTQFMGFSCLILCYVFLQIVKQYDIIFIQEIRDKSETSIDLLVDAVNDSLRFVFFTFIV